MAAIDLDDFDAVLLDLDGTIYHEEHPLPGAIDLLRRLQSENRNYACISNSTTSPQRLVRRLEKMGAIVAHDRVYTAAAATADYVLRRFGGGANVFNLATDGLHELLDGRVRWVTAPEPLAEGSPLPPCDVVIAGAPANVFATDDRQRAALYFLRGGAALVGVCADRLYPSPRGLEFGSGPLTAMLAYAARVEPVFNGKPQPLFFRELCGKLGVEPGRCVLVGDNLETDIAGAKTMGMAAVLTLTGITRREDLDGLPPPLRPDRVVRDLTEF